jgi:hypothetical protein
MFFRSSGAAFAVAVFGTVLTRRLATELPARLGQSARLVNPQRLLQSPAEAHRLPAHLVDGARGALAASLHTVFVWSLPLVVVALVFALLLKEVPLRTSSHIAVDPAVSGD